MFSILILTFAPFCIVKAQTPAENMKAFFDAEFPGIRIQVTATNKTQPGQNITVILTITTLTEVNIESFNLSIFGLLNGKDKFLLKNLTWPNVQLNNASTTPLNVPENVWGLTYGEIRLKHSAKTEISGLGNVTIEYNPFVSGFTMTYVENVYLAGLEELLTNLNSTFWQIFKMNLTLENLAELNKTYQAMQVNQGDLDNTRRVVAVLAVTTVFFVATTVYMFMRKPKQYF